MPRKYNLRKRDTTVKWIEDDTLKETEDESESEDEDYEPPTEEEESEEVSLDEEDNEDDEEEEEEDDSPQQSIRVPVSKHGYVKIEIDNRPVRNNQIEFLDDDEGDDEDADDEGDDADGFLGYLMNKYVPSRKLKKSKKAKDDEDDEPALELNDEEQEYYDELSKSKQKKVNKQMKQLATLVKDGDVPYKFRILELPIPDMVKATVIKKLDMLDKIEMDGENYKLRAWVEGFLRIPFGKHVPLPVKLDDGPKPCAEFLADTRKTLDAAVYGMHSAKTQVMQILAQWISNPASVGNVVALKGPMGVGKTSFANHGVAKVLKRPFEFFSLGGASDAANFVGHSFTYEGSTWGRVVDSLMRAQCMNPVMYFDELDKISETPQGQEIVSMLIHMTDRSQNTQFHDRYFAGMDFDLSQCLFVFSFNDESKVHPILKDRMHVIHCSGYTADEKKIILTQYVWPQILDRIKMDGLTISDEAIKFLIAEYSKDEEGVRTLMRAVETLVTRINLLRIADEETAKSYKFYTKITLPLTIDTDLAKLILEDMSTKPNESWRHLYT